MVKVFSREADEYCLARRAIFYAKSDTQVADQALSSLRERRADLVINAETVGELCRRHFGESPSSVTPADAAGTFHLLYRVSLPGAGNCILRASAPVSLHRAFDFYIDRWVADTLGRAGLPVPPVYCVDISREFVPFDYEILAEAEGRPLNSPAFDARSIGDVISNLGGRVASFHRVPTRRFGPLDVRRVCDGEGGVGLRETWKEYIHLNLDEHIRVCFDTGAVSRGDVLRIVRAFEQLEPLLEGFTTPALLHGDLSNGNIFSDGKRITALIDWEDCLSGDPVFDIASWGTFVGNDDRRGLFVEGYGSAGYLPADFELRYWLYYLRVMLAKTVHRRRFKYLDRIPPARRIRKGLKELEWAISAGC